MSIFFFLFYVLTLFTKNAQSSKDYSDCQWFGNRTNAPSYPIGICSAHSYQTELDDLWLYSTKMECNQNGELTQFEYNNTECDGSAYNAITYRKEDGYYFNCDAPTSCPYAKFILRELTQIGNDTDDNICAWDKRKYHETSMVTNICIDWIAEYNRSYLVDCTANSITTSVFVDADCQIKSKDEDQFVIEEGCDDVFDINAYVQIAECEDANYKKDEKKKKKNVTNWLIVIVACFVGLMVGGLFVMMASIWMQRRTQSQINSVNVDNEPLNVDFRSIGDAEPESTQIISTQGQDIHPIPISGNGF